MGVQCSDASSGVRSPRNIPTFSLRRRPKNRPWTTEAYNMDYLILFVTWGASCILFILLGISLISAIKDQDLHSILNSPPLAVGASFFTGMSFTTIVFRIISYISGNAHAALYITLAIIFSTLLINHNRITKSIYTWKKSIIAYFIGTISIASLVFLYWLPPTTMPHDVNALLGSLHSGRYVNIANYISKCGYIPIIGQNIGQSLLLLIIRSISTATPFEILFLLLVSSISALSFFVFGILYRINQSSYKSAIGALIFMLGGSALSLSHIMIIDSGSPFFLNGYTDTILGCFSIIAITALIYFSHKSKSLKTIPLLALFTATCFLIAPQNIIFIFIILALSFTPAIAVSRFKKISYSINIKIILIILICSAILLPMGGMLTPKPLREAVVLEGIQSVENSGSGLKIDPWIPYYLRTYSGWSIGNDQTRWTSGTSAAEIKTPIHTRYFFESLFHIEASITTSIRVILFPILGIFLIIFTYKKRAIRALKASSVRFYVRISLAALITSLIFTFPFSINAYKLELSRFSIPFITLGMLGFAISTTTLLSFKKYRTISIVFIVISLFGTLSHMLTRVYSNTTNLSQSTVDAFLHYNGSKVLDYQCGKPSIIYKIKEKYIESINSSSLTPINENMANDYTKMTIDKMQQKKATSISLLLSTSGQLPGGQLRLDFTNEHGSIISQAVNLNDLNDNQYNEIPLPVDRYTSIKFHYSNKANIKFWSKNNEICTEIKFSDKTSHLTSGCPENLTHLKNKPLYQ